VIKRSPLFYVGDKYKLLPQLLKVFPANINNFYEPFIGGGSVFLNIKARKYKLNDVDENLINIHRMLMSFSSNKEDFFSKVSSLINKYNLSRSYIEDVVPLALKKEFKKTYFARFNRSGYQNLRSHLNKSDVKDPLILYVLLIYGFNRMLRFNSQGDFNIPVGNVDFNKNVYAALVNYFDVVSKKNINFSNNDFVKFINEIKFVANDFVYVDPPYLITATEYNKIWDNSKEEALLNMLTKLNNKNVKFALSNVIEYQGRKNSLLHKWMSSFNVTKIQSNYINYHHNGQKLIKEILVTNY
jgi:DNA adenine methylase